MIYVTAALLCHDFNLAAPPPGIARTLPLPLAPEAEAWEMRDRIASGPKFGAKRQLLRKAEVEAFSREKRQVVGGS